jgi:hypothetical protein
LENHLGISEKTLAEFIIELSKDRSSAEDFGKVCNATTIVTEAQHQELPMAVVLAHDVSEHVILAQALAGNGAEMSESLVGTLWNIIQRLKVR